MSEATEIKTQINKKDTTPIPDTTNDFVNTLIRVSGDFALRDTTDNARQVLDFLELTKEVKTHEDYEMVRDARNLIKRMAIEAIDYVQFQLSEKQL